MELLSFPLIVAALVAVVLLWVLRSLLSKSPLANIAGPRSPSFFLGHLGIMTHRDSAPFHLEIPNLYGGVARLKGLFGTDVLYVTDPLALHHVVVKDSHAFPIPDFILEVSRIAWGDGILTTEGSTHRRHRKMLIPAFNAAHLRGITPIFQRVADDLRVAIKDAAASSSEMNILDLLSRCALELIGQGGLGASFNTLDRSKPSAYNDHAKNLFPLFARIGIITPFMPFLTKWLPGPFLRFVAESIPVYAIRELVVIIDYLTEWSIGLLRSKRDPNSDRSYELGDGKDIMSILLKANDATASEDALPDGELLGLITQLVFAAHDTTSNAMTRILDLLTKNQDVQDRMRTEILQALENHETLDYDTIQALPYLDAVCRETLRVYPPVISFNRNTAQDTVLPLRFPVKSADGKTDMTSVLVPKGTMVVMGLHGPNWSKDIWGDDAQEWKPDRWLKPLPASVAEARVPGVYSHMMTFMGGNHSCIGFKFSELEMKVVMAVLLSNFRFLPSSSGRQLAWGMGGPMFPYDPSDPNKGPQLHVNVVPLDK